MFIALQRSDMESSSATADHLKQPRRQMGPNPPPPNVPESEDDLRDLEQDGWQVGFEVEFNGVGHEGVMDDTQSEGSGNLVEHSKYEIGWDSDPPSDDESGQSAVVQDCYTGYQCVPVEAGSCLEEEEDDASDPAARFDCTTPNVDPDTPLAAASSWKADFDKQMGVLPPPPEEDVKIEHKPRHIDLDEDKISTIRSLMTSFTLAPPPKWADGRLQDTDLKALVEQLHTKE
ncbi:unnamed protein product, partial [Mesorhabditis spiculigera]